MTVKNSRVLRNNFVFVPIDVVRDFRLSSNAFRILAFLLSLSDGQKTSKRRLAEQTNMGRDAVRTAVDLLVELDYLDVNQLDPSDPSTIEYVLTEPCSGERGNS